MCVAIPLGRRSDGPPGSRLGRYLRARPWRFTAAVPLLLAPPLAVLWAAGGLAFDARAWVVLAQGLIAAPLFGLLLTGLPTLARTSTPEPLWFAAQATLFLAGGTTLALGWDLPGLAMLGWGWWQTGTALGWHLSWSRTALPAGAGLLPLAARGGALALGLTALAAALGQDRALPLLALVGLAATALIALLGAWTLGPRPAAHPAPQPPVAGHA